MDQVVSAYTQLLCRVTPRLQHYRASNNVTKSNLLLINITSVCPPPPPQLRMRGAPTNETNSRNKLNQDDSVRGCVLPARSPSVAYLSIHHISVTVALYFLISSGSVGSSHMNMACSQIYGECYAVRFNVTQWNLAARKLKSGSKCNWILFLGRVI